MDELKRGWIEEQNEHVARLDQQNAEDRAKGEQCGNGGRNGENFRKTIKRVDIALKVKCFAGCFCVWRKTDRLV